MAADDVAPPAEVQVGPHRYTLTVDADEMNRVQVAERRGLMGHTDHAHLKIVVSPDQAPDQAADTILHEVLHTITWSTNLDERLGAKREEDLVCRLTPLLLDVLRRNPDLVRYLTTEARS